MIAMSFFLMPSFFRMGFPFVLGLNRFVSTPKGITSILFSGIPVLVHIFFMHSASTIIFLAFVVTYLARIFRNMFMLCSCRTSSPQEWRM